MNDHHRWIEPSLGVAVAFVLVLGVVVAALLVGVYQARRRAGATSGEARRTTSLTGMGVTLWLGVTAGLAASGFLARQGMPPPLMIFFVGTMGIGLALALSPFGRLLKDHLPITALIAFQAFRLPLELVLHRLASEGVIPVQMTFDGHNFDIVSGCLGLAILLWALVGKPPRAALWAANLVGIGLLLVVTTIAVLSSPVPINVYGGQRLLLALHLPYVFIVPVGIAGALFAHVVTFRALLTGAPEKEPAVEAEEERQLPA